MSEDMTREEAERIVLEGAGRRPDLMSGKDYVDRVRHGEHPGVQRVREEIAEYLWHSCPTTVDHSQDLADAILRIFAEHGGVMLAAEE